MIFFFWLKTCPLTILSLARTMGRLEDHAPLLPPGSAISTGVPSRSRGTTSFRTTSHFPVCVRSGVCMYVHVRPLHREVTH